MGTKEKYKKSYGTHQTFLQGALILTAGMVVVKLVGALFKIPLANIVTENGMGFFNNAYTFYAVLYSLSTAGFPVAVAKMVAESFSLGKYNDVKRIKEVSLPIFLATGAVGTAAMLIGASAYSNYVHSTGSFLSIVALAPSIFFCCAASVYRGYYEGLRNMYPTAVSEVLEAVGKLVIGLSGSIAVVFVFNNEYFSKGTVLGVPLNESQAALTIYSYGAAAAVLGVTAGSILSYIYLFFYCKRRGNGITKEMYRGAPKARSGKFIAKRLICIAVPVGIGSLAMSLSSLIDSTFLQQRLHTIMENSSDVILNMYRGLIPYENLMDLSTVPNYLWGCYSNALTIFMFIPSITLAFGVSALPSLTDAWTRKNHKEIKNSIESVMRITSLFCFPAGIGLAALSEPIANFLYGSGAGSQITARILIILGIGAIFSALNTPVSSMLQAVGRVDLPVKFLVVSLIIKVVLNYILCGIAEINVLGAGTGTLFCYLFVTVAEIIALVKITRVHINFIGTFLKPLICAIFCGVGAWVTADVMMHFGITLKLSCVAGIASAVIIYAVFLLLTKSISKNDVLMLPKGEKIVILLEKRGWIG